MRTPANDAARNRLKRFVDAWITVIIDSDIKRGRSQNDFVGGDITQKIRKSVPALNAAGFDVYQGGGNVFQVRYSPKGPLVIQVRAFAQRMIRPMFT